MCFSRSFGGPSAGAGLRRRCALPLVRPLPPSVGILTLPKALCAPMRFNSAKEQLYAPAQVDRLALCGRTSGALPQRWPGI